MTQATTQATTQAQSAEPASLSYFYGPGFSDIIKVVTKVLAGIRSSMNKLSYGTETRIDKFSEAGIFSILNVTFQYVYWLGAASMQLLASITFCLFMLLPQVIIFCLVEVIALILTNIVKFIDILYFKIRRVSLVCDTCHERYAMPVYLCPKCGETHKSLVPNRFGTLHHRCICGEKLPSSILVFKSPRKSLDAICPNCLKSGRVQSVQGSGSRSILIPVVGGESAGKTALITAYTNNLFESRLPLHNLDSEFYSDEKKNMFATMQQDYQRGMVEKTRTETNNDVSSVRSFSFYIRGNKLKPQRLMQIYDIAGETFVENQEHEQQRQYKHSDGIVLVIDPMSLPNAEALWGSQLAAGDKSTISSARLEDVMSALNNNLHENTQISRKGKLDTPLAVVLSKIDEAEGLSDRMGAKAIARLRQLDPKLWSNDDDAMDFLCRQFLVDMDMPEIVDLITQNFKNSRFFAVSAIGHTAGDGSSFNPQNVDTVMDWIIRGSDSDLAEALGSRTFSKAVMPLQEPAIGLFDQLIGTQE